MAQDTPFDPTLLSAPLRPVLALPLEVAEQCVRAFAARCGNEHLAADVSVSYSASSHFQAHAYPEGQQDHVRVAAAVPALLLGTFFEVVRFTDPFSRDPTPPPGDATRPGDYRIPLTLPARSSRPGDLASGIENLLRDAMPPEKWQRILAVGLAELATVFVFAHEIAHVVYGHARILHACRGVGIFELGSNGPEAPGRIARAWELQADRVAFGFLWSYAINTARQRKRLQRQLMCKGDSPELAMLGRLTYVVSFVFFLLSQGDKRVRSQGSHPSPLVRVTFLTAFAETAMEQRRPDLAQLVHACVTQAHESAEAAWNRLGLDFGIQGYREHIDDLPAVVSEMHQHVHRIERTMGRHAWANRRSD